MAESKPELTGKVALITGASRGIGKACAEKLAQAGADIAINYCENADQAQAICQEISAKYGIQAACFQADISQQDQVESLFRDLLAYFGRLDILVNNAGITRDKLILRMSSEDWDAVIDTNLKGVFYCSKLAAKHMLKQKQGCMINIASIVGITGNAGQVNYAAAKAGVIGLTKSLALELAPRGIRVNAVAPGFVDSDMTLELNDAVRQDAIKKIPLGRFGSCDEVAEMVSFLSSDRCQYVTGQTIHVDGGLVMS